MTNIKMRLDEANVVVAENPGVFPKGQATEVIDVWRFLEKRDLDNGIAELERKVVAFKEAVLKHRDIDSGEIESASADVREAATKLENLWFERFASAD